MVKDIDIIVTIVIVFIFFLILNRLQLFVHHVHLGITNGVDVAVQVSRARSRSFDLKMHAIFGVDKTRSVAVQCCVGHQRRLISRPNLLPATNLVRTMLGLPQRPSLVFLLFPKNRSISAHMCLPSMPVL